MFTRTLIVGAALALSTAAFAVPAQISDSAYIQAERCQALFASSSLGREANPALDQLIKEQSASRIQAAYDRGQEAHETAARQARAAGPDEKTQLIAERDGVCHSLTASADAAGSGSAGRTN